MPTVFEEQKRLAKDKRIDRQEKWKLIRRSMWISIFLGVTVSVALLSYAFFVKQWEDEEPEPSLYYSEQKQSFSDYSTETLSIEASSLFLYSEGMEIGFPVPKRE